MFVEFVNEINYNDKEYENKLIYFGTLAHWGSLIQKKETV